MMRFNVITLFPESFAFLKSTGLVGQAYARQKWRLETINLRNFGHGVHRQVDDRVYGGGDGMLLSYTPLAQAVESIPQQDRGPVVLLSPQGKTWNQSMAQEFINTYSSLTLICARYAGVDERFVQTHVDEEISIGDFILNGGEAAAFCVIESMVRLVPGVLGNLESAKAESFCNERLEPPQYTRPAEINGLAVPEVLYGGHAAKRTEWQLAASVLRTLAKRADLLKRRALDKAEIEAAKKFLQSEADLHEIGLQGFSKNELLTKLSAF